MSKYDVRTKAEGRYLLCNFHIFLKFIKQTWRKFWQSMFSYVMTFGIYEVRTVYMANTESFFSKIIGKTCS